jgi:membrane fusion protein (multidrug efflux system)
MPRYCSALPRLVLVLPVFVWLAACGGHGEQNGEKPIPVTTQQVEPRSVPLVMEAVGRTEGSKEVEIRARVSGIVQKRLYDEGSFVRAGAPLFQIERAPFEIALAHAKATADQAEATNEQARRETDRLHGLLANAAVSKRLAEEAETAYRTATAQLAAARAAVHEAELNLSYTSVVAPITGVTGRALHSEGSLVTANTDSSLLTTMSQTHPVWVRFALSEAEHLNLRKAGEERSDIGLVLANGETYGARGHLNFAASTVDQQMGTVQLRAEFPNPQLQILPGQFATVHVEAGSQSVLAVPQSAVLQGDLGRYVWVIDSGGKAAQRAVDVGAWVGQDWIIRNGLNAGDTVILDNLMKLKPGVAVVAQTQSTDTSKEAATAAR